ncbi:sensor histidine kinase [Streptomyces sp. NPDC087270]|uniref:sensor histidine kinase n=1 Tax=Streptomyces sp. NPDC087270 TaxID=3365774 RepID=UPI0037F63196
MTAVPLGAVGGVAASGAALIGLYVLALRRTAGLAAAGAALAVSVAAATAAAAGLRPWNVAGTALVAAGAAAVAWVLGRSRRRRRAERSALAAYRTGAPEIPRFAALAERDRLAVELHDVAAHRLTAIVVSAAAARRLADPGRAAAALSHAATAARQAITELDVLTDHDKADLDVIAALAAESGARYRSTATAVPPSTAALAHRVVREALTNAARYARGSAMRVTVEAAPGLLTVTVGDSGGTALEPHLGTGHGLLGLRTTVAAAGGVLSYGPDGADSPHGPGWTVRAELPFPPGPPGRTPGGTSGPRRRPLWRGPTALDWALVVLAVALSLGASLLSDDVPDAFRGVLPSVPVVVLSGLHAVPLGWRSRAPGAGLVAVLSALVLWWGCDRAGWTRPPVSDIFLVYWWVELTFLYSAGAYLAVRRGLVAPVAVAATGGLALASADGITGNRAAAWAALTGLLAVPSFALWWLGLVTARRRERRAAAAARGRELLERDADAAVRDQRRLIAAGLLRTARQHAANVADAADAGRLDAVLDEARAALGALRELLRDLRGPDGASTPPPTVAGIAALAGRYGATVRYRGPHRAVTVVVGVAAYRIAALLLAEDITLTVLRLDAGVELTAPPPGSPGALRQVRAVADAVGGTLTRTDDDAVRVWLPEVFPSPSG